MATRRKTKSDSAAAQKKGGEAKSPAKKAAAETALADEVLLATNEAAEELAGPQGSAQDIMGTQEPVAQDGMQWADEADPWQSEASFESVKQPQGTAFDNIEGDVLDQLAEASKDEQSAPAHFGAAGVQELADYTAPMVNDSGSPEDYSGVQFPSGKTGDGGFGEILDGAEISAEAMEKEPATALDSVAVTSQESLKKPDKSAQREQRAAERREKAMQGSALNTKAPAKKRPGLLRSKLSSQELSAFCTQVQMMLATGAGVYDCLSAMCENASDAVSKGILHTVLHEMDGGASFSAALLSSGVFPAYFCEMVKLGEDTGFLEDILYHLSAYYERDGAITRGVRSAMFYPLLMLVLLAVVLSVVMVVVLPMFKSMFAELGVVMNGFSKAVMDFGLLSGKYAALIAGVLAVVVFFLLSLKETEFGRRMSSFIIEHFPLTRTIKKDLTAARVACALELTLSSGMDDSAAIASAERFAMDPATRKRLKVCKDKVAEGLPLGVSLSESKVFEGVYSDLALTGFEAGAPSVAIGKIADHYNEKADEEINRFVSGLEPFLVAVLAIAVGALVLAVMLPMMGVLSSVM